MNGYSSHTFMWVNAKGERYWVKYHFKTNQGIEVLTQEEADRIAGADADYHRRDLFEAIKRREYPSWTLKVQIMPFKEAETYRFNPFDLTKVWPHGDYPVHEVGQLTLNRNPSDYHAEIGQAVGQLIVEIPEDVPVRLEISRAISGLTLPSGFEKHNDYHYSPGARDADKPIKIQINQAIGNIIVRYRR